MKSERGFNLIEMLIVLAMIAIVAAIMIPTLRQPNTKSTARSIYVALQQARSQAVGSTQSFGIQFDLDASPETYQTVSWNSGTSSWDPDANSAAKAVENGVDIVNVVVNGTTYTTGARTIGFTPLGTADTGLVRLESKSDSTDRYKVEVTATTGKATVSAGW